MTRAFLVIVCALTAGTTSGAEHSYAVRGVGPATSGQTATAVARSGIVRGRITAADTGKPVRRTRVTLLPVLDSPAPTAAASTNARGEFELKDVPAGSYYVTAARAGYVAVQYGQRRARERGLVVNVRAGGVIERIDIALPPGGVLAGRVTDELGEPYPGVRVMALELRYNLGRRVPFPAGSVDTDDLGEFRIAGLQPGSYYLSASSNETWQNEKKETLAYAATFFPGGTADTAQTIDLATAEERSGLDLMMSVSRAARVRGRVMGAAGQPLGGGTVSLSQTYRGARFVIASRTLSTRAESDGTFEIRNVAPAEYQLRASGTGEGSASMVLAVTGDIEDLVLVPRTGSTIYGSIVADEGAAPPFPASGVRVFLIAPDENVLPTIRVPAINNDWTFRLENLGGPFLFRLRGLPSDWMLDSVRLNDKDIADVPYDVPTGGREITGLQLVVTQKVGTISGEVLDPNNQPTRDAVVILFADDPDLWMPGSRFSATTRPDSQGRFSVTRLPAGAYLAVAKDFILDGQWEDKAFLENVRRDATRVILNQGGTATITLKLPLLR